MQSQPKSTHLVDEEPPEDPVYTLFHLPATRPFPMVVTIQLNQTPLDMEVDTGATASLISEQTYKSLWPAEKAPALQPSEVKLRTYTGEELKVLGAIDVDLGTQQHNLSLLVVQVSGPSLLGRDWMVPIRLDWHSLNKEQPACSVQTLLSRHDTVLRDELGRVTDATAKVYVDPQAPPKFCKAWIVPYALKPKVESELQRLQQAGVIKPKFFRSSTKVAQSSNRSLQGARNSAA